MPGDAKLGEGVDPMQGIQQTIPTGVSLPEVYVWGGVWQMWDIFVKLRLFLQSDNTVKELRNQYSHRIGGALVQANVFRQVGLHHMVPGHTHEDVDGVYLDFCLAAFCFGDCIQWFSSCKGSAWQRQAWQAPMIYKRLRTSGVGCFILCHQYLPSVAGTLM